MIPAEKTNQSTDSADPFEIKQISQENLAQNSFSVEVNQKEEKVEYHLSAQDVTL